MLTTRPPVINRGQIDRKWRVCIRRPSGFLGYSLRSSSLRLSFCCYGGCRLLNPRRPQCIAAGLWAATSAHAHCKTMLPPCGTFRMVRAKARQGLSPIRLCTIFAATPWYRCVSPFLGRLMCFVLQRRGRCIVMYLAIACPESPPIWRSRLF